MSADRAREDAELEAVRAALRQAEIDPTDFGRFVGRVVPGVIDFMLWRAKTERSREVVLASLTDEDVALHAMSALRRMVGNEEARSHIAPLVEHPSPFVARSAREALRRIDKKLGRARPG